MNDPCILPVRSYCLYLLLAFLLFPLLGRSGGAFDEAVVSSRVAALPNSAVAPRYTPAVRSYIRTYVMLERDHSERILGRALLYFPLFERYLAQYDLPQELKYLAVVESALDPKAVSHAGAVGLWQFMPETGKAFGLEIDRFVDERCNPEQATDAAMRYLKKAYERFGEWELAIAAYNSGGGRVNRAIKRGRSKDFWKIQRFLPRETRNYVPAFIGAHYLMAYHEAHDLKPRYPSLDLQLTRQLHVNQDLSFYQIAQVTGLPLDVIEMLNPTFKKGFIPRHPQGYMLILPKRVVPVMRAFLQREGNAAEDSQELIQRPVFLTAPEGAQNKGYSRIKHRVGEGETIFSIARLYELNVHQIKAWNDLPSTYVHPGQQLTLFEPNTYEVFLPVESVGTLPALPAIRIRPESSRQVEPVLDGPVFLTYTPVEKEKLENIVKKFHGISMKQLMELNRGVVDRKVIQPGTTLKIRPF